MQKSACIAEISTKSWGAICYIHPIWWSVTDANVREYDSWQTNQSVHIIISLVNIDRCKKS